MGPLRRGLILAAATLPAPAWAEVCDKERPTWVPKTPAAGFEVAAYLLTASLGILLAILIVVATTVKLHMLWAATALAWSATTCGLWLDAYTADP